MLAYGPADATASQNPSSLVSFKSRLVLPFRTFLVVLENRPLKLVFRSDSGDVTPADRALRRQIGISLAQLPDPSWKRPPGQLPDKQAAGSDSL